ncbi:hypothetical protein DFH08DRAFT_862530 [Mycena albidolilacea]|uniref:NmrA-like domain-containing protein n=1 Tax=Mycena albidolilacea TaxID=1033008 RepID=A0AAD7A715_9AGAR|nr:hypothetical protein DFH08DRAFT_862530 [Mycena albidolilacea]
MSVYKSFAVVGGGKLGLPILNALAAKGVSVILLSRPGSTTKTVPSGVPVVEVDSSDAAAVAAVFKEHKIDVALATLGAAASAAQKPLVDAAKLAGVKLFVPSEYGFATDGSAETGSILANKDEIAVQLKSVGIPSTRIYTGMFAESIPWIVDYSEGSKIKIVGKGDTPVSVTSIPDIAGFVAHVLTTAPPSELEDRILRLEGDRTTLSGLAALFNTSIEHVDGFGDARTLLQNVMATGAGSTGWDGLKKAEGTGSNAAGSANALWPGHQWQSIKEIYKL